MYASVCLSVCMYLQCLYIIYYVYISIRSLPSWLAVCLSAFAHLSLSCLCVCPICLICPTCLIRICLTHLSYVLYLSYLLYRSFIAISILSLYILCLVSYLLYLSYCYLINICPIHLSTYLSIDLRIFMVYQILFNPMHPIYPTMPCIYPVSIHLMRTVRLDRKSRPSSLILFFKHPTPAR